MDKNQFTQDLITEAVKPGGNTAKKVRDMFSGNSGVDIPNSKKNAKSAESQITRIINEVSIPAFSANFYTPGSDLAAGTEKNQIVWGRDGNDTLLGLDPFANSGKQIDILIGDLPITQSPNPSEWRDRFILGDAKQPYYLDGGLNDFALILDFNRSQDIIQLNGARKNYQLAESSLGTEIYFQKKKDVAEFIGFLPFVYDLSLKDNYFQFEGKGNTPPKKPVVEEAEQLGTNRFDLTASLATDPFGNVYTAGTTSGSLGGANAGERDALAVKYDSDGNQLKITQFGSSSADTAYSIATDNIGNFYLTGITTGNLAGPRQSASIDAWLAKYDSNGNQQWIRQFGTDVINQTFDIEVDDNNNVYLSGITVKNSQPGSAFPGDDYWVTKYDTNGNRQWFREFGGSTTSSDFNFDEAYGVAVSGDGNVYASGWTLGNLGGTNAGSYDGWLAKYDSNGNQQWVKQLGTSGDDEAFDVDTDLDGSIYVTGYTDNNLGGTNAGFFDAWVAKYDSNGNQKWIQQFGTPNNDQALGVTVDDVSGSVYVTGSTESTLGYTAAGTTDSWVAKLDTESGSLQNFTGTANGKPSGKKLTGTSGNDRIIGSKRRDIITGAGGNDIFVYQSYKDGRDTITDFGAANDLIDLSPIFASSNYRSTTPFSDYVQLSQLGSNTAVQINPVGDARDTFRTLLTLENTTATDLSGSNFIV